AADACGVPEPIRRTIDDLCPTPAASSAPEPHGVVLALGCETLAALSPNALDALQRLLTQLLEADVTLASALQVSCCGDIATRGGDATRAESARHTSRHALMNAGLVLSDCGGFSKICDGEVVSLYDELARHAESLRRLSSALPRRNMVLHGACHARRTLASEAAERTILDAIGVDVIDLPAIDNNPDCCGAEAMYRATTKDGAKRAAMALDVPHGAALISSSVRCAAHLAEARDEPVTSLVHLVLTRCGELV
ncbi:MAG: Fe-S oxidoreductase, partial [Bradymonadia bacterium]